jgi:hypothetical protein
MLNVLYNRDQIGTTLKQIFSQKGRRVAVAAFVGQDAIELLGKARGVEVICWPKGGATNPDAVRALMQAGAKVFFSDNLHMKLYWSPAGCIIGSANLSANALGNGSLKEIGVLLSGEDVDIDSVLRSVTPRRVTRDALHKLDQEHAIYTARNPAKGKGPKKPKGLTFGDWMQSPYPKTWKLGWWDQEAAGSRVAKAQSKSQYGVPDPKDFIGARKGQFAEGDWALSFRLGDKGAGQCRWMRVDFAIRVPQNDPAYNSNWPYEAVQVFPLKRYGLPPFRLDKAFQKAFGKAIASCGSTAIRRIRSLRPSEKLLGLIRRHYHP